MAVLSRNGLLKVFEDFEAEPLELFGVSAVAYFRDFLVTGQNHKVVVKDLELVGHTGKVT